ncbi:MAG: hypothetical protein ACOZBZ_00765 [Patescibacteria group bacterium]
MLPSIEGWLRPKNIPPPQKLEPLVFLRPKGGIPISTGEEVNTIRQRLRENPETTEVMKAVEEGPNVVLYQKLVEKIKETRLSEEWGEYLVAAASALFFGNIITDANIEGMIRYGGPVKWRDIKSFDIMHLSEVYDPESILLEERVMEIMKGEFTLPQSKKDLERNVELQIARIGQQLIGGTLERKARTMGVNTERGKVIGEKMITALRELRDFYIRHPATQDIFNT